MIALTAVQVALPLALIAWLALAPPRSLVGLTAQPAATGALLVALTPRRSAVIRSAVTCP